jgi:hypothetical protein
MTEAEWLACNDPEEKPRCSPVVVLPPPSWPSRRAADGTEVIIVDPARAGLVKYAIRTGRPKGTRMIYFIKDTVSQAIKIGHSDNPEKRIGSLQTGNPHKLQLLGTVPGTELDEVRYHDQFASYRMEGEWFRGDIIEDVLNIIAQHRRQRVEVRRTIMTEEVITEEEPLPEPSDTRPSGVVDSDTGVVGICRIPGLRMKKLSLKLTEREPEKIKSNNPRWVCAPQDGIMLCGVEMIYLLEFEADVTDQNLLYQLRNELLNGNPHGGVRRVRYVFMDEDNAVIPFGPACNNHHIIGGMEAITGVAGEAFRVVVVWEKQLDQNHHAVKIKTVFMGENYTGEHPLKKAKKLSVSIR